ncbi:MAG: outer membrane beta-barrel protein [Burkholderiales bacterium]|nr:outer membrane beta-barrel protein [Burkholderiales bacterium]
MSRKASMRRQGRGFALALTALVAAPWPVLAQGGGGRDYAPMVLGDWLFTPTVTAGGIYNDNVFSSSQNKVGRLGSTLGATGYFSRVDGLSKSQLYFTGRADVYPSETKANAYTGALGATHAREFGHDLLFNGAVEVARIQNSLQAQTLTPTGTLDLSPTNYTQFQAQASLRKTFNRLFVEGGGSFVSQYYDDKTVQNSDRNGWSTRIRGRVGYEVAPLVSVFVEPSLEFQRYSNSFYDTDGHQVVGGLTSPRWRLLSGEVYAGYMTQRYPNANVGSQTAPTFGGSLSWFPTEDIIVTLAAQQTIGLSGPTQGTAFSIVGSIPGATPSGDPLASVSPAASAASPTTSANAQATQLSNSLVSNASGLTVTQELFASPGSSTKTTTVSLGGRYLATQAWTLGGTFSYQASTPQSSISRYQDSEIYLARFSLDYSLTPNWGLSGTYSYARVLYDTPGLSYGQNIVTLAVNGRL